MIFDITPMGAVRMTQKSKWNPVAQRYLKWKMQLAWLAKVQKYELGDTVELVFHLPMPSSWSQKKKDTMRGTPCQSKPDLDNLVKAFFDALVTNDQVIYRLVAEKRWAETGAIEIRVQDASGTPVAQ